ncbi:hypothetical protein BC833DRAFT_579770 [Globomyces pollinis-pini]|nr:hypothetical protein BC833DRAFT_579770 [Globomyces pollinis-pini]
MGGNALKDCIINRIPRDKYTEIIEYLTPILNEYYSDVKVPKCFPEKADFGDVDFLVVQDSTKQELDPITHPSILSKGVSINGNIMSFEYREAQIDIIAIPNMAWSQMFYDWLDFGMIIGILARAYGYQFSPKGLSVLVSGQESDSEMKINPSHGEFIPLFLTSDPVVALKYFGFDADRYAKGFTSMEECFLFFQSSPKFKRSIFDSKKKLDMHAHRPMYKKMVEWLRDQDTEVLADFDQLSLSKTYGLTLSELKTILITFNQLHAYEQLIKQQQRVKLLKSKYNGKIVEQITSYTGKDLGTFIKNFKEHKGPGMDDWILATPEAEIVGEITTYYNETKLETL